MELKFTRSIRSSLILPILLTALLVLVAGQTSAQGTNLIKNGGFEDGFDNLDVATGWKSFRNGKAEGSFHDDTWELVVVEGDHSQMIELVNGREQDAYAGIYQSVDVVPEGEYRLTFKGMVRSSEGSITASNYGYRLHYAIDLTGNQDWQKVKDWVELPWDEQLRTGPADGTAFKINDHEADFTATAKKATIFFRAWKKWPDRGEGNFNLDGVRLVAMDIVELPPEQPLPTTGHDPTTPVNWVWPLASAALLLLLVGSAIINQRHRLPRIKPDQTKE